MGIHAAVQPSTPGSVRNNLTVLFAKVRLVMVHLKLILISLFGENLCTYK